MDLAPTQFSVGLNSGHKIIQLKPTENEKHSNTLQNPHNSINPAREHGKCLDETEKGIRRNTFKSIFDIFLNRPTPFFRFI